MHGAGVTYSGGDKLWNHMSLALRRRGGERDLAGWDGRGAGGGGGGEEARTLGGTISHGCMSD